MGKPEQNRIKIGIIGLGSIGRRHARALGALGVRDLVALRTNKGSLKGLDQDLQHIKEVGSLDELMAERPAGILICNPTSLHVKTLKMVKAQYPDMPVFVEKPLANDLDELSGIAGSQKVYVGYCLRFNRIIRAVKAAVEEGKAGKILKASLYCGHYLPAWHPYEDYRQAYSARKDLGGGVLRTLSHEIDLAQYFFGAFEDLDALLLKKSDLEIDVEDAAILKIKMAQGIIVEVELDFINPEGERCGEIVGEKGKVNYSFSNGSVKFTDQNDRTETLFKGKPDLDVMYQDQMRDFLDLIAGKKFFGCDLAQAIEVNKVIDEAEKKNKGKKGEMIYGDVRSER
jgi:predicted dehydrogenase